MPPANEIQRFHMLRMAAAMIAQLVMGLIIAYMTPFLEKQPYHTSLLTGHAWVQELTHGHPDRIKTELGMRKHVFHALVHELRTCGLRDSKYILLDEQVSIFLYTCVTGLSSRHVAERFQHSHTTTQKYVHIARYSLSHMSSDISRESCLLCLRLPSTTNLYIFHGTTHLFQQKYQGIRNSFHTSKGHLGPWMVHTLHVVHPWQKDSFHETERVLSAKIVLHAVHLIFGSSIFSVVGMDQPQTRLSTIMPVSLTCTFHEGDTTLQMLGLEYAIHFSFRIEVSGTTWLSGVELQFGEQYVT